VLFPYFFTKHISQPSPLKNLPNELISSEYFLVPYWFHDVVPAYFLFFSFSPGPGFPTIWLEIFPALWDYVGVMLLFVAFLFDTFSPQASLSLFLCWRMYPLHCDLFSCLSVSRLVPCTSPVFVAFSQYFFIGENVSLCRVPFLPCCFCSKKLLTCCSGYSVCFCLVGCSINDVNPFEVYPNFFSYNLFFDLLFSLFYDYLPFCSSVFSDFPSSF